VGLGYHAATMSRHLHIDCHRLLCPMPAIRAQETVQALTLDDLVTACCTDPGALQDTPAWCHINGHEVVATESLADDGYRVTLKVERP